MKKILFGTLMFALMPMIFADVNAAGKAEKIIKKVLQKYEASKTFKADFEQVYHWVLTESKAEQSGTIWLEGKEKFKIQTENQLIVSDGKTVWTYSKSTNQVLIDNVQNADDITLPGDIMLNFLDKYIPIFIGEEKVDDIVCNKLELSAKKEDQFIQKVNIWVGKKDFVVYKIEQIDLNKNSNTYALKSIQFDLQFPQNFFLYTPPDSVEVIDMR